jgi:hypothetical protein
MAGYKKGLPISSTTEASLMSATDKTNIDAGVVKLATIDATKLATILTKLAGGTTGQVLKKKTNTDYDVEWVTED